MSVPPIPEPIRPADVALREAEIMSELARALVHLSTAVRLLRTFRSDIDQTAVRYLWTRGDYAGEEKITAVKRHATELGLVAEPPERVESYMTLVEALYEGMGGAINAISKKP